MTTRGKPWPEYVTSRPATAPAPGTVYPSVAGESGLHLTHDQLVALIVANTGGAPEVVTQAEYNALTPNPTTVYYIVG